jgi:hypothetical protein
LDNLPETIDITPDWQGMFQYAIRLTEQDDLNEAINKGGNNEQN